MSEEKMAIFIWDEIVKCVEGFSMSSKFVENIYSERELCSANNSLQGALMDIQYAQKILKKHGKKK